MTNWVEMQHLGLRLIRQEALVEIDHSYVARHGSNERVDLPTQPERLGNKVGGTWRYQRRHPEPVAPRN